MTSACVPYAGPHWIDELPPFDWDDLRDAHRRCRSVLDRLAGDRGLLSRLVAEIEHDPVRLATSEIHPLINRLILYQDDARHFQVRLHMSPGSRELVPHDHKYSFTAYVLAGAYVHVWRRRTGTAEGEFTSQDIRPGIVSVERPGTCYTFGSPLIHQTIMLPGTVTLFMRGPRTKQRSHAAMDMLPQADDWPLPSELGKPKHANGQRPVTIEEYRGMCAQLVRQGLIDAVPREREPR
ncbi:hypothetical protein A6A06_01790 [Streptomyces sp. CB02923]|uniref:hypothetical protein n=1 Tax=Streptomyces sp. CB02923 TaxID=1718985 RepID=UPI000963280E|nr:hypothetical protein [Streptomyces sp. CB02923]OKI09458.1 hypothetical protein A6A06_01790 [Streptomyces sp. CB02923]